VKAGANTTEVAPPALAAQKLAHLIISIHLSLCYFNYKLLIYYLVLIFWKYFL
jgi:hypothetical protein